MVDAYRYAAGERLPRPWDLSLLSYIDRFGAQAVMGRPTLSAREIRLMSVSENVVMAYRDRKNHKDGWAAWAQKNPEQSAMLIEIETKLIDDASD